MQCVAVCCRLLQCVSACCSELHRVTHLIGHLACFAVCCSVLQCVRKADSQLQSRMARLRDVASVCTPERAGAKAAAEATRAARATVRIIENVSGSTIN